MSFYFSNAPNGFINSPFSKEKKDSIFSFSEEDSPLGNWQKYSDNDQFVNYFYENSFKKSKSNINIYNNIEQVKSEILDWFEENSLKQYIINIFFDSDGDALLEQYKNKEIKHNEIAVFFETKEGFNFTGSIYRIRLGKTVVSDLNKFWFQNDEVDANELAKAIINKFPKTKEIGAKKLEKLISGELSKENWTFDFQGLFSIFKLHPLDFIDIFSITSKGILSLRPNEENFWNPNDKNFKRILPVGILMKSLNLEAEKIADDLSDNVIKTLDTLFDKGEQTIDTSLKLAQYVIPPKVKNKITDTYNNFSDLYFKEIRPKIRGFIEQTISQTEEYIYILNAFFAGFISGLLKLIASILDLIGLVLKYGFDKDFKDSLAEQIENLVEQIFTNTKAVLNKLWEKLKNLIKKTTDYITIDSSYELSYKIGESIFEIAEIVFSALKLAKTKKITDLLKNLQQQNKAIDKKINTKLDEIENLLDDAESASKKNRIKMIQKLWDDFTYNDLLQIPPTKKPCFLAGTQVSTQTGLVAINKLTIGQKVYTYNFKTNVVALQPILKLHSNKAEKYLKIHTNNDVIKATGNHRFWLPKTKKWIPASQLKEQDVLQTQQGALLQINKLEIIETIENTYNLEIKNNPNYYVGKNNILVHNGGNKISKFASTELINVEFYKILNQDFKSLYVGQTIQGYDKRYSQHLRDPKKAHWRNKMKGVFQIDINDISGPYKMTPYEAAVTELYEINKAGGKRKGNTGLFNKQNPIGKKKFNRFKNLGFNPCKFYV